MESFETRLRKLTAELDAISQSMQTLRTDMTNMSAEIKRLTAIQVQRITARADEEKLKADLETAREFQVHLYMRWLTQQHRQMFIILFVFVIIVLQKEANEEYYKERKE